MHEFVTEKRKWTAVEVAQLLISHTALVELRQEDALKIVQRMHTRFFKEGDVLVQEGLSSNSNSNSYMLLILNGKCKVENESVRKSDSLLLDVAGPGHIIGEMGLLDGEPRSATCKAHTDMDVAVLDREALSQLLAAEPAIGCKLLVVLLHRISSHLRATNKKLSVMTKINHTLEQKIASLNTPQTPRSNDREVGPDNPLMF
jgi:CRP/FNR family cyclic AMP-dependent transcriptional regulator